ncbi:hypothetical protein V4Y02_23495 [Escherichia coli]
MKAIQMEKKEVKPFADDMIENPKEGAGVVAQWWSACLACVKHWVQSSAPHKSK